MQRASILSVFCFFALAISLHAQPTDISRWFGNTALTQPQGFNNGDPLRLTWGMAALNAPIQDTEFGTPLGTPNNLQTRLNAIYGSQSVWQPILQSTFDRWSSVSGLSFQFESNDDGAPVVASPGVAGVRADIRIAGKALDGNSNVLAYNYFPNNGDMVIDTDDSFYNDTSSNSLRLRNVVLHEIGHGLGMAHVKSNDANFLLESSYSPAFDGPQYHDILVAQRGYGDVYEKSFNGLGNDVVERATSLGTVLSGGALSIGNDARSLVVLPSAVDFVSIDDSTDTDFYQFSISDVGTVSISLDALGFTYNATNQDGAGNIPFNTAARSDLGFSLLGTDGSTLLANVNASGLGGVEVLSNFQLAAAGSYFIRINGINNSDTNPIDTQFYGLSIGFTAVPEPGSFVLLALAGLSAGVVPRRKFKALDVRKIHA
jgi:hypothetical protein